MKRIILLFLLLFAAQTAGNCVVTYFPPLQPYSEPVQLRNYNNSITSLPDPFANQTNLNYSAVARIENALYGHTFTNQNISVRLERIERSLFNTTFKNATPAQRIDNIISNFNQLNKYPNISANVLSRLENKIFSQTYQQNSVERRIERLEQQIFGAVQSGDIDARYEALVVAAKNYNATASAGYLPNASTGYMVNPAQNRGLRGVANALLNNALGGTMTGFTPPIGPNSWNAPNSYLNPYSQYPDPNLNSYSNGYGNYQGYRSNHRMYDNFNNFNTGTGVHILD